MTAVDPAQVIAEAAAAAWKAKHGPPDWIIASAQLDTARAAVAALEAAGLAVVPVARAWEEWAVEDPERTAAELPLHLFGQDRAEAESLARYHGSLRLLRRAVQAGPWEPTP